MKASTAGVNKDIHPRLEGIAQRVSIVVEVIGGVANLDGGSLSRLGAISSRRLEAVEGESEKVVVRLLGEVWVLEVGRS